MQNLKLLIATMLGTLILILGVGWWLSQSGSTQSAAMATAAQEQLMPAEVWTKGATESAQFTIVEFSDFQCPGCAATAPVLRSLIEEHPDKVRLVYRHFPLRTIHPHAELAARVAEAAGQQGKFWEMHDELFASQETWAVSRNPREHFTQLAAKLELNMEQYEKDLESDTVRDRIARDESMAGELKLSSTPSLYLNGEQRTVQEILKLVEWSETVVDGNATPSSATQ